MSTPPLANAPTSATPPSPPTSELPGLVFGPDKKVKGGSIERLLRWIAIEQHDISRTKAFLYSFRAHITTAELWTATMRLEESVTSVGEKAAIHAFIREWAAACFEADFRSKQMLKELLNFAASSMSLREANQIKLVCVQRDSLRGEASIIRRLSGTVSSQEVSPMVRRGSDAPFPHSPLLASSPISISPILPLAHTHQPGSLFDAFKTDVLAGSLTVVASELMQRVMITEFINGAWQKARKAVLAPGLTAVTDMFNRVSFWVATEILSATSTNRNRESKEAIEALRRQAKRLKKAIKVLHRTLALNNFHCAIAIVSGLNLACIQRLKRVWSALTPAVRQLFDEADELLAPNSNWTHYRELLRSVQAKHVALVPYSALFLRDLTFVQDGNPDTLAEGKTFFNWDKMELLGTQISNFCNLRRISYSGLHSDKRAQTALQQLTPMDEDALMKKSEECEPRKLAPDQVPSYDEVIAKEWREWNSIEVAVWAGHHLGEVYVEVFRNGGVDGSKLVLMDDAFLVELGVQKLGHRKRIQRLVANLRDRGVHKDDDSSEGQPLSVHSLNSSAVSREPSGPFSSMIPAQQWGESEVLRWLDNVGEGDCKASFLNMNGAALLALDTEALERLGIDRLGQRKRIARKISELREGPPAPPIRVSVARTKSAPLTGHSPALIHTVSSAPMLSSWTDADLVRWLEVNDLGEYCRAFAEQKVTGKELLGLGEEGLTRLGITKLGHRKRLLRLLEDLRSTQSTQAPYSVRLSSSPP